MSRAVPLSASFSSPRIVLRQILLDVHLGAHWSTLTNVLGGQHMRPNFANGFTYRALGNGRTGGVEPIWSFATPTLPVADGSVQWVQDATDPLDDVQWVRARFSVQEPVATAQFMCPKRHGNYLDEVEVNCGALPGYGALLRFKGRLGNPSGELWPAAVTHNCSGELQKAALHFNSESTVQAPLRNGEWGLWLPSILAGLPPGSTDSSGFLASAATIVKAVLAIAGVSFNPADIHGSSVAYGGPDPFDFVWHATVPPAFTQYVNPSAGESALAFIQRFDEIDAEWGGEDHFWEGGFYRTCEGLGGRVYRHRIGGKPYSPAAFVLTEGINILEGNIERQFPQGNRMLVQGKDWSGVTMRYLAQRSNPFMDQAQAFAAPNPPSSTMIAWQGIARDPTVVGFNAQGRPVDGSGTEVNVGGAQLVIFGAQDYTTLWLSQGGTLPSDCTVYGQNCQTVAEAALLEANKETPQGHVVTPEDFPFTPFLSVLVQAPGGTIGRLLSGELFAITTLTLDCGRGPNGEPQFRHTLEITGGGLDANSAQLVDGVLTSPLLEDTPPPA